VGGGTITYHTDLLIISKLKWDDQGDGNPGKPFNWGGGHDHHSKGGATNLKVWGVNALKGGAQ